MDGGSARRDAVTSVSGSTKDAVNMDEMFQDIMRMLEDTQRVDSIQNIYELSIDDWILNFQVHEVNIDNIPPSKMNAATVAKIDTLLFGSYAFQMMASGKKLLPPAME